MEWTWLTIIVAIIALVVILKFVKSAAKLVIKGVAIFLIFLLALYIYNNFIAEECIETPVSQPVCNCTTEPLNIANDTGIVPNAITGEGDVQT